ncbi:MAG: LysR family transcriptional regulator [Akkermansiaceae bacterium]|nr:LysR family transcriptional regulator [Akkermansiaceae bacterium]
MHFEPQQLKVFTALMHERSVGRAAVELRTSASNVRRIWASLEEELGESLFDASERGHAAPTKAAERLEREITSLLTEVRRFEDSVRSIHRTGRVLRLGADRNVFNTSHFGHLFNTLRHDPRFRISFVEVSSSEGRSSLEAGACDLLFAIEGTPGRRFETRDLPSLPLDVACMRRPEDETDIGAATLAEWNWALATFSSPSLARDTLRKIQRCGGGSGQMCSQHEFLRWAEGFSSPISDAVVCIRPVSFRRLPRVSFHPLNVEASYPLHVSYLRQHPFEFLETIVQQMDRALKDSTHGSRSAQS